MRLTDRQTNSLVFRPSRANRRQVVELIRQYARRAAVRAHCELNYMLASKTGDQFARRPQRYDFALIDNRHPVAKAFGLVHIVRRQQNRPPAPPELPYDLPEFAAR